MKRKEFLKILGTIPLIGATMKLNDINKISASFTQTQKMPVLFVGHVSPMNAILENEFVQGFRDTAKTFIKPNAILCISAHWETRGTMVSIVNPPKTIHDFGGLSPELFEVQYPAPGSPALAREVKNMITKTEVALTDRWGLDHGAWTVLKHFYPNADIPVFQISLDYTQNAQHHYELAKELSALREKGVLIMGSGNMVHNLGLASWDKMYTEYGYDWTLEASEKMKNFILSDNHKELINYKNQGKEFQLAIPSPDHYLPLLYALALKDEKEEVKLFNDKAIGGSFTMTSLKIG
jgi:4,5-DOPA dioxygenase extradiol